MWLLLKQRAITGLDDKALAWIDGAKKKADWFDPAVARVDEFFGKREHEKSEDEKGLKRAGIYLLVIRLQSHLVVCNMRLLIKNTLEGIL